MNTKTCPKCNLEKSIDNFYIRMTTGTAMPNCKRCYATIRKMRYNAHREEEKVASSAHRKLNPDYYKQHNSLYTKEHRKEINENVKKRHSKNPEKRSSYCKKRRVENIWSHLWQKAKTRAKRKGLEFTITKEEIKSLVTTHCPVLGIKFDLNDTTKMALMSLDRVDNAKGYTPGNVEIISYKANSIKNNGSLDEFEKLLSFYSNPKTANAVEFLHDDKSKQKARKLLNIALCGAARRNILYSLSKADKTKLCNSISKRCPVLGIEIGINNNKRLDNSLSVDRIDNSKGYELNNLIFVCWKANRLKSNSTVNDLKNILAYMNKRKASEKRLGSYPL